MSIEKLSDNVYANIAYDGGNVACVNTSEGMVLMDTPMLPQHIEEWKLYILNLNPTGVKFLINSHIHFDHILGNRQLRGTVISHEILRNRIFDKGATLREDMAEGIPGRTEEETQFILNEPLIPAQITFTDKMTIHLGDTTCQLQHIGGHTSDSIVIYLPEEKVLFSGDIITSANHPYKGDACFSDWLKGLNNLKEFDIEWLIPGHGEICKKSEINRFIDYFQIMLDLTNQLIQKGSSREAVVEAVNDALFGYFAVEQEMLERSKLMFDFGTRRLFDELTN